MPKLEKTPLDIRIREMNLKRGVISHKDIENHNKQLPDDSDHAEELVVYEEETESAAPEEQISETEPSEDLSPEELEAESSSDAEKTEAS